MYSKMRGASTSEGATFSFCPGIWGLHDMYAFTSDGRLHIAASSTFMVFFLDGDGDGDKARYTCSIDTRSPNEVHGVQYSDWAWRNRSIPRLRPGKN